MDTEISSATPTPEPPDRMPAATALDILTDRTAKHSSAFKRTAREARENNVSPAKSPGKNPLLKLRLKLARLTLPQLNRTLNRCRNHSIRLQRALARVPETMAQFRTPLSAKLAWVETVLKASYLEAVRRKAITENYPMFRTGLTTYEDELKKYPPVNENAPTPAV